MIIILGMAGAGKSTQCRKLVEAENYQWFSVGQLLRQIEKGAERAEMAQGKVLDDAIVTPIVRTELARRTDNPEILLDGCPRTVVQAKWLASAIDTPQVRIVLHLVVSDEVAIQRLTNRHREDDTEEAIKVRFAGYHHDIQPVLAEFENKGVKIATIDATKDEEGVYQQIIEALK